MESLEQTKGGLRFKAPKSDRARAITLPDFAIAELRRLKRQQAEELLLLGVRQNGETVVCARADGMPLQPRTAPRGARPAKAHSGLAGTRMARA
jgi:hypothetical protein